MIKRIFEEVGTHNKRLSDNTDKPLPIKHTFSVDVNIAPALARKGAVMGKDYGYIVLPKSYTDNGEPTRLIIVCHGASTNLEEYQSTDLVEFSQTYWVSLGYAIMDMYASPPELASGSEMHYGNPVVLECYEKGFWYVMENFNLKKDGIFVVGSSMGGLSAFQIVQSQRFPVLAQVANAPVTDIFKQAYCNPWAKTIYQRERIAAYFGFEGEKPEFTELKPIPSRNEIDYFKENFDKILQYSPIFAAVTDGDIYGVLSKIPLHEAAPDCEEAALYAQLSATHPCPLLIIHNKDDSRVSYRYSEYLYGMIKRGNSACDVRLKLYESGGHTAWDYGTEATVLDCEGNGIALSESKRMAIEFFSEYES